jgi:hypothetical protein
VKHWQERPGIVCMTIRNNDKSKLLFHAVSVHQRAVRSNNRDRGGREKNNQDANDRSWTVETPWLPGVLTYAMYHTRMLERRPLKGTLRWTFSDKKIHLNRDRTQDRSLSSLPSSSLSLPSSNVDHIRGGGDDNDDVTLRHRDDHAMSTYDCKVECVAQYFTLDRLRRYTATIDSYSRREGDDAVI